MVWLTNMLVAAALTLGGCPTSQVAKPDPAPHKDAPKHPKLRPDLAGMSAPEIEKEYRSMALRNACPQGLPKLQGNWRFIGRTKTPDFSDELRISGTKFVEQLAGIEDGKRSNVTIEGEIRCLYANRVLMLLDKVTPEGGYGNTSGEAFPCDVLDPMDGSKDRFLLICFFNWDLRPVKGKEYEYGRIK